MTNDLNYPFDLRVGKKYFQKQMLIYAGLAALMVIAFLWQCYSYMYGDYYYPKVILVAPLAFIAFVVLTIKEVVSYKSKNPIASITQEGIQFYNKPCNACGLIQWSDVANIQEFAEGRKGRKFAIYVNDLNVYINLINSNSKRKALVKFCKNQGGALAMLSTTMFDVNPADLKKFINDSIAAAKQDNKSINQIIK